MAALLKNCTPSAVQILSLRTCQRALFRQNGMTLNESFAGYCQDQSDKVNDMERYENIEARTIEFSPSRTRDHSGATLVAQGEDAVNEGTAAEEASLSKQDAHFDSYDAHGSVSLNSAMQSTVPEPYKTSEKAPTHLNMPGGHVGQGYKYLSGHLQNTHYSRNNNRELHTSASRHPGMLSLWNFWHCGQYRSGFIHCIRTGVACRTGPVTVLASSRHYADESRSDPPKTVDLSASNTDVQLSSKDKLKRAVKDYGSTVLVFHIGISLMSLGGFYLAVSSGLDVVRILDNVGFGYALEHKLAAGATTFVVAYAVHKVFAPVRIGITLTSVPFIVRYLRKIGFLKVPKSKG